MREYERQGIGEIWQTSASCQLMVRWLPALGTEQSLPLSPHLVCSIGFPFLLQVHATEWWTPAPTPAWMDPSIQGGFL